MVKNPNKAMTPRDKSFQQFSKWCENRFSKVVYEAAYGRIDRIGKKDKMTLNKIIKSIN